MLMKLRYIPIIKETSDTAAPTTNPLSNNYISHKTEYENVPPDTTNDHDITPDNTQLHKKGSNFSTGGDDAVLRWSKP